MEIAPKLALYHKIGMPLYHVGAFAIAILYPPTREYLAWFALIFALQTLGISLGYHRLFSHRSYRAIRSFEFLMAVLASLAGQGALRRWALHHRLHHQHTEKEGDPHSPKILGFWNAHILWRFDPESYIREPETMKIQAEWAPEIRFIDRLTPPLFLIYPLIAYLIGGWAMMGWACLIPTVFSWHITFFTNSWLHTSGSRQFETADNSHNSFLFALFFWGEGWHNNHHAAPKSARLGLRWYQVDSGYYLLKGLQKVGVVTQISEAKN